MKATIDAHGVYTIRVVRPDNTESIYKTNNLIVNNYEGIIAKRTRAGSTAYFALGTGTSEPALSDTGLTNEQISTRSSSPASVATTLLHPTDTGRNGYEIVWDRADTGFSGTFTEIGIYRNGSTPINDWEDQTVFTSRALIRDESGTPVSVVVEPGDTVYMRYAMTLWGLHFDVTETVSLNGTPYNIRLVSFTARNEWDVGYITAGPYTWFPSTSTDPVGYGIYDDPTKNGNDGDGGVDALYAGMNPLTTTWAVRSTPTCRTSLSYTNVPGKPMFTRTTLTLNITTSTFSASSYSTGVHGVSIIGDNSGGGTIDASRALFCVMFDPPFPANTATTINITMDVVPNNITPT